jgi:hypothetical protein
MKTSTSRTTAAPSPSPKPADGLEGLYISQLARQRDEWLALIAAFETEQQADYATACADLTRR